MERSVTYEMLRTCSCIFATICTTCSSDRASQIVILVWDMGFLLSVLFYRVKQSQGVGGVQWTACYSLQVKNDMSVRITIEIPDEIAAQLAAKGPELSRTALEALALEEF